MHRLENPVRPYAWGSPDLIPAFLGESADGSPVAEVWMGAHPDDPSTTVGASAGDGGGGGGGGPAAGHPTLEAVVAADPVGTLGEATAARFGRLPFLVKLLGIAAPLSLQVHPDAAQAAAGHAREEAAGTPAAARSYGDPWHKPEVGLALTDVRLLAGVRDPAESLAALDDGTDGVDAPGAPASETLVAFRDALRDGGGHDGAEPAAAVRAAVDVALGAGPAELAGACEALAALAARRARRGGAASLRHAEDDACVVELQRAHPADVGVLLSVLLHHVTLAPGQAVFLGAGQLHAYRSGLVAEVMASSDNVLRAGLTRKAVDVDEVLAVADLAPVAVPLLEGVRTGRGVTTFAPPVDDFALDVLDVARLPAGAVPATGSPRVALVLDGEVSLVRDGVELEVRRGGAVFVPAGAAVVATSTGRAGPARLALARVGAAPDGAADDTTSRPEVPR